MPKFKLGEPPQWQAKKLVLATRLVKQNDALINQNAMIISTLKNIEIILKSKRC